MNYKHLLRWGSIAGAGALAVAAIGRGRRTRGVAPELHSPMLMMLPTISPTLVTLARRVMALAPAAKAPPGVRRSERLVPGDGHRPPVRIVMFERTASSGTRPALLWIHGGGYVVGTPEQGMAFVSHVLDRIDVAIVSVDYRLAPEHPFPAPLDDCHAALCWLVEQASDLAIDTKRIAIGGQSAGGGLAAALVQRAVDSGPIVPAFQLLVYPMLDAATTARSDHGESGRFAWTPKSNHFGWASYLGRDPTMGDYPDYAVPAQRGDLTGLPPAWIGVGTLDLFHDEDVEYGERLRDAGVSCVTHVTEGGYHGFDIFKPRADATLRFYDSMLVALAGNLGLS